MDGAPRLKVTAKVSHVRSATTGARSPSPPKASSTVSSAPVRLRAKMTTSVPASRGNKPPTSPSVITRAPSATSSTTAPLRAPSPSKQRTANGAASPHAHIIPAKPRVTARALTPASSSVVSSRSGATSPEPRSHTSMLGEQNGSRRRGDSLTLQRVSSFSSLGIRTPAVTHVPLPGEASASPSPSHASFDGPIRVKSKVSGLAKKAPPPPLPSPGGGTPSSPPGNDVAARPNSGSLRIRAVSAARPSISFESASPSPNSPTFRSNSPSPSIYPITTASPAANTHRYAVHQRPGSRPSSRAGSPALRSAYLPEESSPLATRASLPHAAPGPISKASSAASTLSTFSVTAKVDPTLIPLPPQSPPASTVSFSSKSSASASSWVPPLVTHDSFATAAHGLHHTGPQIPTAVDPRNGVNGIGLTAQLADAADSSMESPNLTNGSDAETTDGNNPVRERAAAKSNRKIADLEITNRSLLAINSSLEATKHRQQKEIVDLRRKLRESRLALPPRAYRAILEQAGPEPEPEDEDEDDESSSQASDKVGDAFRGKADETYRRCCALLDTLLNDAQAALAVTPRDLVPPEGMGGAKVLTPEEVRSWRRDSTVSAFAVGVDDLSMIAEGASRAEDGELEDGESFAFSNGSGLGLGLGDLSDGTIEHKDEEGKVEASLLLDEADPAFHPPRQSLTPPIVISPPTSP